MSLPAILYIGSLDEVTNSYKRFKTLQKIGCKVTAIDSDEYILSSKFRSIHYHFNLGPGISRLNRKIRDIITSGNFEIVWVDNKTYLTAATLSSIKEKQPDCRIVNLLTDDPFGRHQAHWKLLNRTIPYFDFFFVQRKVNVGELYHLGAKRVEVCYRSYDPEYNKPIELSAEDKTYYGTRVGFIGTYENVRAGYIAYLIKKGIAVQITGNGWPEKDYWDVIMPNYKGPTVYDEKYIKSICGMEIALHFLRHGNRDEQDSRTFEIPSCKVFMLAERSEVHMELFEEDKEAVFFSSKEELFKKLKYYLAHPEEVKKIADAGYRRCISSGYTHQHRLQEVLNLVMNG